MTHPYTPTEDQIARVLKKTRSDPRKLAIAYLKAQHRARQADAAFNLSTDLNDAIIAAACGRDDKVEEVVARARRRVKMENDHAKEMGQ